MLSFSLSKNQSKSLKCDRKKAHLLKRSRNLQSDKNNCDLEQNRYKAIMKFLKSVSEMGAIKLSKKGLHLLFQETTID